jgi:hypothetical protein
LGPVVGKEDLFEGVYREKFRALCREHGEFVVYERDRAALDLGLHLTTPSGTQRRVSRVRIWFQMKGIQAETLPYQKYREADDVSLSVALDHLKFWFASPEPVYLAVYVESADTFLVEDVRELVYARWGEQFLAPGTFAGGQRHVTLRVPKNTALTPTSLERMRRHQSMRIDGPFFRGRPLGHRLDPLRCSLNVLDPQAHVAIVQRLLEVHDYRTAEQLEITECLGSLPAVDEHASLTCGRLYNTFEWVFHLTTEFGVGPKDDFRVEGTPEFAHGPCAAFVHGSPHTHPTQEALRTFAARLSAQGIRQLLVFANTDDYAYFGSFFGGLRGTGVHCVPQLLAELAYSLLTVTVVYLEFREAVSWRWINYLSHPTRPHNQASRPTPKEGAAER